ncbi:MAG: hypothetical protein WD941_04685 [Opitutus sp.]
MKRFAPFIFMAVTIAVILTRSDVMEVDGRTMFVLPPRYRGHEEELVRAYELGGGVRDAGLRRAWSALRDMIGGRATKPALAG